MHPTHARKKKYPLIYYARNDFDTAVPPPWGKFQDIPEIAIRELSDYVRFNPESFTVNNAGLPWRRTIPAFSDFGILPIAIPLWAWFLGGTALAGYLGYKGFDFYTKYKNAKSESDLVATRREIAEAYIKGDITKEEFESLMYLINGEVPAGKEWLKYKPYIIAGGGALLLFMLFKMVK